MYALWTFIAVLLLLYGLFEEVQAPRRRVGTLLRKSEELYENQMVIDDHPLRVAAGWIVARVKPWLPSSQISELREQLLWAGQPLKLTAEEFLFGKFAVGLVVASILMALGFKVGYALIGLGIGYLLPERILNNLIQERQRQLKQELSHFVHLLATALEAGLPMVEAVRRVASEAPGLLAAEMLRTVQEMAAGKPAVQAWKNLTQRTNCQELRDVVAAIVQSQEYGVAAAEQLRFQMKASRTKRQREAQEKAQAASVKMRIPTILLIMMPTMVILMGPAAMSVIRMMRRG